MKGGKTGRKQQRGKSDISSFLSKSAQFFYPAKTKVTPEIVVRGTSENAA
jgi:hypothetical protein